MERTSNSITEEKKKFQITLYGAHGTPEDRAVLDVYEMIKLNLRKLGYLDCNCVYLRENIETEGHLLDPLEKSIYYLEKSDVNVLIFFQDENNDGVGRETTHVLDNDNLIPRSRFIFEMRNFKGDKIPNVSTLYGEKIIKETIQPRQFDTKDHDELIDIISESVNTIFYKNRITTTINNALFK